MTIVPHPPTAALRGHVRSYYGFGEETGAPMRRREGPGTDVVVILSFEREWLIGDATDPSRPFERHTSFTGGLRDTCVLTEHAGSSAGMQINLTPPAARMLLRVPMSELAHRTVSLDDVLGGDANRLVDRLHETPGWEERFALLDETLTSRLADAPPPSREVVWAWRRLTDTRGRVRVASLADELGWSRRRLAAKFRDEIGVPPKTLARVLRFEHAKELLERAGADWARVAVAAGYYDQSHLSNEFRAITGTTPTRYAAELAAA